MSGILEDIKKIVMKLLDEDEAVRHKVKEVAVGADDGHELANMTMQGEAIGRKQLASLEQDLAKVRQKTEELRRQKEDAERLCGELQQQLQAQENDFEAERKGWEKESSKLQKAQKEAEAAASRWEEKAMQREEDFRTAQSKQEEWRKKQEQASKELKQAKEMLAARFSRGWELFKQYPQLGTDTREELSRVFVSKEDFESFICCGAQSGNLEDLWEIVENCWERKASDDWRILQELFVYCVELANKSYRRKIFVMLDAQPGDEYDNRIHALESSSKKQGTLHQVCVQGFYNAKTKKVIKKSLVNLE